MRVISWRRKSLEQKLYGITPALTDEDEVELKKKEIWYGKKMERCKGKVDDMLQTAYLALGDFWGEREDEEVYSSEEEEGEQEKDERVICE